MSVLQELHFIGGLSALRTRARALEVLDGVGMKGGAWVRQGVFPPEAVRRTGRLSRRHSGSASFRTSCSAPSSGSSATPSRRRASPSCASSSTRRSFPRVEPGPGAGYPAEDVEVLFGGEAPLAPHSIDTPRPQWR